MFYYVFYLVAALNFAAFLYFFVMYAKESIKCARYRQMEEYIRNLEIENLKEGIAS